LPACRGSKALGSALDVVDKVGNSGSTVEAVATRMGKLAARQIQRLTIDQKWLASPCANNASPA
jgi:hypothetical protein